MEETIGHSENDRLKSMGVPLYPEDYSRKNVAVVEAHLGDKASTYAFFRGQHVRLLSMQVELTEFILPMKDDLSSSVRACELSEGLNIPISICAEVALEIAEGMMGLHTPEEARSYHHGAAGVIALDAADAVTAFLSANQKVKRN